MGPGRTETTESGVISCALSGHRTYGRSDRAISVQHQLNNLQSTIRTYLRIRLQHGVIAHLNINGHMTFKYNLYRRYSCWVIYFIFLTSLWNWTESDRKNLVYCIPLYQYAMYQPNSTCTHLLHTIKNIVDLLYGYSWWYMKAVNIWL